LDHELQHLVDNDSGHESSNNYVVDYQPGYNDFVDDILDDEL
jgi:hypothetical protein